MQVHVGTRRGSNKLFVIQMEKNKILIQNFRTVSFRPEHQILQHYWLVCLLLFVPLFLITLLASTLKPLSINLSSILI